MADVLEKCPHCGIDVLYLGDTCPNCQKSKHADVATVDSERRQAAYAASGSRIRQRPVSDTVPRLLLGGIVVSITTFAAVLLAPGVGFMGAMGVVVGLGIVTGLVFRDADVLDKLRWKRYWRGHVAGYVATFVIFLINQEPGGGPSNAIMVYVCTCAAGFGAGICSVLVTDRHDKAAIVERLRRFAELGDGNTEATPNSGRQNRTDASA